MRTQADGRATSHGQSVFPDLANLDGWRPEAQNCLRRSQALVASGAARALPNCARIASIDDGFRAQPRSGSLPPLASQTRPGALGLLGRGEHVVLVCRSREKGEAARAELGGSSELFVADQRTPLEFPLDRSGLE